MLEIALVGLYIAALSAVAIYAFQRPNGVYWRSAAGLGAAIAGATLIWWLGSPAISGAAGVGAFFIWFAFVALVAVIAAVACVAASVRHLLNAFGTRLIV